MSTTNNCEPCAPVPSVPSAPPPFCPPSAACEEFIPSDCVISTVDTSCTATFIPPNGDDAVVVGLDINVNTTLTNVYNQLTTTACIFNQNVIGAFLQTIGNNALLTQVFCDLVNSCPEDDCANVIAVEIATYTDIEVDGFNINFFAQPNYKYEITINDSNATPFTVYSFITPVPPNTGLAPALCTRNTSLFTKNVGGLITNPPPPTAMTPGHSYEVYINAVNSQNESCPAGPWTVVLPEDPTCGGDCDLVQLTVAGDPLVINNLAVIVDYQAGTIYPIQYQIDVYESDGTNVSSAVYNAIPNVPVLGVYPAISQTFNYPSIILPDTYTVEVTPICSVVPFCTGQTVTAEVVFGGALACAAPDITNVTLTSP